MLSKSLIQFFVEGWGCVPSLLFDLRPNYGGGNKDNGDFLQKVLHSLLHSMPPTLHQAPTNPRLHQRPWTLTGKSGSGSCGVTAPFSWVLVHTRFCLWPPRICFPVLCKFWWLYGGLMATSSKRAYATPRSTAPRAPAHAAVHC